MVLIELGEFGRQAGSKGENNEFYAQFKMPTRLQTQNVLSWARSKDESKENVITKAKVFY